MYSVLYVDDEPDLLELGKIYLERSKDFKVETASSGRDGLDLIASRSFDAIVSDYQMPEMNGLQLLTAVRRDHPHLPFIIFTGRGREEVAVEAFERGADFYLQKGGSPVAQFTELVHKVQVAVDRRRAEARVSSLNRLYSMLSATDRAIVHIGTRDELLSEICRIVVEIGGFSFAWAGIADTASRSIRPVATSGKDPRFLNGMVIPIDSNASPQGPTGNAFHNQVPDICNDIASDPRMKAIQKRALGQGYKALAAFPFGSKTSYSGVLTLYAPETGFFDDQITPLLEAMAQDITFALSALESSQNRVATETELRRKNDELNAANELITATDEELRANYDELAAQQQRVLESEQRYRHLIEAVTDYIFTVRIENGRAVETQHGPGCEAVTGYTSDDFSADPHLWIRMVLEEDRPAVIHQAEEILAGRKAYAIEHRIRTRGGEVRWVRNTPVPYTDPAGGVFAYDGIIQDITKRKAAEDAMRESAERFGTVIEESPSSIQILSPDGRTVQVNRAFTDLWGLTLENLTGYNILADAQLDERGLMPFIRRGFAGETLSIPAAEYDAAATVGSGRKRWIQSKIYPVRDPAGSISNVIIIHDDITEQKQAEEALRASEARYRAFFVFASNGIVVADAQTRRFLYANPAFCRMLRYTVDEIPSLRSEDIHPKPDLAFVLSEFQALVNEEKTFTPEIPCLRKDGTVFFADISASRVVIDGRTCLVGFFVDVTERKNAETALRHSNRQLNLLTRITRHDIHNKVTAIFGYLDLAKNQCTAADVSRHLEAIEAATRSIQDQIGFTGIYQQLGAQEPQWQDLRVVLGQIEPVEPVRLDVTVPPGEIFADLMLPKVFFNLIDNSLRHGGHVTTITVYARAEPDILTITYEDDGTGIPERDKDRIFEQGYGKNTGLGLFLVREILSMTGITIHETGRPGEGARFVIRVPKGAFR